MPDDRAYGRILAGLGASDPAERRQALTDLEALANTGHVPAMCRLGTRLVEDPDVAAQARGAILLRRAAEAGNAKAQFRYGLLLTHGRAGESRDPAAAVRWCHAAAEQGLAEAQYNLGLLLATGTGVDADAATAGHWLRMAAINGLDEAAGCLDLIYRDPGERPKTWDDAETRLSVVLAPSESGKPLRFAEFYLDPCLDLLMRRFHIEMAEAEDIVQQFFLELEEPLAKGEHRGLRWKEALRERYDDQRGSFRPYLGTVLGNFARDWIRRRDRDLPGPTSEAETDPQAVLDHHAEDWRAMLTAFATAHANNAPAHRPVALLRAVLGDGSTQLEAARALGISERTARSALHLGAELLLAWLAQQVSMLPTDDPVARALRSGLVLLPGWLHHPGPEKRARALLLLALARRRLDAQRL